MAIVLNGDTGISSIGTLTGVTSISSVSANTPVVLQDSGTNSNTCRAWVNFNGTGTVAIRASFNVSSITDNGTGDYTVNFTNAMADANYSAVVGGQAGNVGTNAGTAFTGAALQSLTTSGVRVLQTALGGTVNPTADSEIYTVAIFR